MLVLISFYGFITLFVCTMIWIILGNKIENINTDDEDI